MEELKWIFQGIAGECEDLGADDARWGYPNGWQDLCVLFQDVVEKLEKIEEEYLEDDTYRREFDKVVKIVMRHDKMRKPKTD